jgi:hypothetical protein
LYDNFTADIPIRRGGPVYRRERDFEFVDLIPLSFGTLPLRYRKELLQALIRKKLFWLIHAILTCRFADNYYHL